MVREEVGRERQIQAAAWAVLKHRRPGAAGGLLAWFTPVFCSPSLSVRG